MGRRLRRLSLAALPEDCIDCRVPVVPSMYGSRTDSEGATAPTQAKESEEEDGLNALGDVAPLDGLLAVGDGGPD